MTTIINTIVKATATAIVTACGIIVESTSKGVPGQFDKLIGLINQAPEDKDLIIEASLLKGVFKALGEDSKDASTFKCVLSLKGWSLMQVADDWTIYRGNGTGIVLTKNTYNWETQEEVEEMVDYSHEYVPTRWEQVVADELGVEPSKLPEPVYPVVPYTGPVVLPTVIQLGVVYSTLNVDTDQGTKICKFLYTPTGVITCKGTKFESVEALIVAVQTAFKVETQEVSETTQQPQEVAMETKSLTFCQLMKAEWIPSKDTWEAGNLVARMRATWKSGKYLTDDRQAVFMKEFVAQVATLPQGIEMPNSAFLTAYEMVKEKLTGIKTPVEYPETIGKITDEEAVENFEADLPQKGVLTTGTIIPVQGVALPDHLKSFVVRQEVAQEEQDLVDHIHFLEESILERCESEEEFQLTSSEELPERVVVDDKDIYLDEGVCKAIRQACMQLVAENLKGGNDFYKGKYVGSYTVYEPEFWLAKAHQQLHGYYFENYVEEKDTGDLTVEIVRESYRTTPAGDTARAFLGTLGLVSEEVVLDWHICINTPNADEEVGDCFEFGLVW